MEYKAVLRIYSLTPMIKMTHVRNEVLEFMKAFIKKHQYNYIKKCLHDLSNAYKICVDINVIEATKSYIQNKILNLFNNLSEEEKELLDINKITDSTHVDKYLSDLNVYVYGMQNITNTQISKLFKKEKKLKLPNLNEQDSMRAYLSWVDESINKLFVAYNINDKLVGMACRITNHGSNKAHMCCLCNHIGKENEVAFVSPICKTSGTSEGTYRSIGFDICLSNERCNDRIQSVEKLEELLKDVNNIK